MERLGGVCQVLFALGVARTLLDAVIGGDRNSGEDTNDDNDNEKLHDCKSRLVTP
ncbi:hypothetical protein D3C72_2568940 [compost metagenome]